MNTTVQTWVDEPTTIETPMEEESSSSSSSSSSPSYTEIETPMEEESSSSSSSSSSSQSSESQCIMLPAQDHKYTYLYDEDKLHIKVTVVVNHKDGTTTRTKVDKKIPFSLDDWEKRFENAEKLAQAVFKEMHATALKECDKKDCNP